MKSIEDLSYIMQHKELSFEEQMECVNKQQELINSAKEEKDKNRKFYLNTEGIVTAVLAAAFVVGAAVGK